MAVYLPLPRERASRDSTVSLNNAMQQTTVFRFDVRVANWRRSPPPMVEIVGRGKGAKLAFNSLGIPSPNTRRLHRPQRRSVLANSHRWARPKQVRGLPSTLKFVQPTAGRMIANSHRSTGSDLVRRVDHAIRIWDGSRMPRLDRTPLPLLADRRQTRTGVSDHQANSLQIIAMIACNPPSFDCRICDATKHDQHRNGRKNHASTHPNSRCANFVGAANSASAPSLVMTKV
jgi:hypothetical protein